VIRRWPFMVFALLASCKLAERKPEPKPVTLDEAEVAHRVALNAEAVAQVHAQGNLFLWALAVGGLCAMAGLLLVLLGFMFPALGKRASMIGFGLIVFGAVVGGVALAFPHYGKEIALGSAILVGCVLAFAGYIGVTVALAWRKGFVQVVRGTDQLKKELDPATKERVFGTNGIMAGVQDKTTQKLVAKARHKETK
jgi:hypothetical protein